MTTSLYKQPHLEIKIKKLADEAVIPAYSQPGDAGMDLTVTEAEQLENGQIRYKFGLAIEIPEGYVGLLFPRSSIHKTGLSLSNAVGVIDSGYRGELMAVMQYSAHICTPYVAGERAAQLMIMPYPRIKFREVSRLAETTRGSGGYGSTGS